MCEFRGIYGAEKYLTFCRLMDEFPGDFWMALFYISDDVAISTVGRSGMRNCPDAAIVVLARILRWWPEIQGLQDRFFQSGYGSANFYRRMYAMMRKDPPPIEGGWMSNSPLNSWRRWSLAIDKLYTIATGPSGGTYPFLTPRGPDVAREMVTALVERRGGRWDERLEQFCKPLESWVGGMATGE